MIRINQLTKVYVYCPSKVVTGGAELLQQLVHVLNSNGREAYIVYFDGGETVPDAYANYNIKIAKTPEDKAEHVIVLYEGVFDFILKTKQAQILLWWLSVDNLYYNSKKYLSILDYIRWSPKYAIEVLIYRVGHLLLRRQFLFSNNVSIKYLSKHSHLNCYQSEYAQHFLINHGFTEMLPLSDYINADFRLNQEDKSIKKEDIILYNPKKGFKHTKQLMKLAPELNWVPLQGMNRQQLQDIFKRSKLYIDFGFHPGKDRLPREAALNNCCIISGRFGSANFFEDVAIYNEYKIDLNTTPYHTVIRKIKEVLKDYDAHWPNFKFYQKRILQEEEEFVLQTKKIFEIH
jgi:hypothetical protein